MASSHLDQARLAAACAAHHAELLPTRDLERHILQHQRETGTVPHVHVLQLQRTILRRPGGSTTSENGATTSTVAAF